MGKNRVKVLGLVPARGGSKGIKGKNIVNLAGKPLISYVIEALKRSKLVDKIVCSTDSRKIADVVQKYGAEVPFLRPNKMAQDNSPVYPALVYTVKKLESTQGYRPDYIVTIQPTSPLVKPGQIDEAVKLAIEKKADSVITVVPLEHDRHPYNIREILPGGSIKFWKEKEHYDFPTRQMKPKLYAFGNLYVSSYKTLVVEGKLEGKKNYSVEIDTLSAEDVNTWSDLKRIETILVMRGGNDA